MDVKSATNKQSSIEMLFEDTLAEMQFALFAWFDSEVTLEGRCKGAYVSNESLTPLYLDIHKQVDLLDVGNNQLQTERNNVHPYNSRTAPRVIVSCFIFTDRSYSQNPNHGKYTLAQTLPIICC